MGAKFHPKQTKAKPQTLVINKKVKFGRSQNTQAASDVDKKAYSLSDINYGIRCEFDGNAKVRQIPLIGLRLVQPRSTGEEGIDSERDLERQFPRAPSK